MPIITKPSSIQKNTASEFILNKSELAQLPSILADDYFSDTSNWKEVVLYYKSNPGKQKEILRFDTSLANPFAYFLVSEKARDIFQVYKIAIVDFDNGTFEIPRSELTVGEFDIDFSVSFPSGAIAWDISNKTGTGTATIGSNGGITKSSATYGYNVNILSTQTITGDGYVEFTYSPIFVNVVFGLAESASSSGSYDQMLLATYVAGYGGYERIQGGTVYSGVLNGGSGAVNGDIIRIGRTGTTYYIKRNGTTMYEATINNANTLKASISIYQQNNGIVSGSF